MITKSGNTFGNIIHTYTRKDAIEDGALIDVSNIAKRYGIKLPVAFTGLLYSVCEPDPNTLIDVKPEHRKKAIENVKNFNIKPLIYCIHKAILDINYNPDIHFEYKTTCIIKQSKYYPEAIRKKINIKVVFYIEEERVITLMMEDED